MTQGQIHMVFYFQFRNSFKFYPIFRPEERIVKMKEKHYICVHTSTCQHAGTKNCAYSMSMPKSALDCLCGGTFRPELAINCNHPNVHAGVMLMNVERTCTRGNYHSIWPPS